MALFGNKREGAAERVRLQEDGVSKPADIHTLLGQGSEFDGKLTFEGQVRIDGAFSGQISTEDLLIIGESASVKADIHAGTVVVYGTVEGTITAKTLIELHPPARVKGTLETPALAIEKGVVWEGTTKMEQAAKAPPPLPRA